MPRVPGQHCSPALVVRAEDRFVELEQGGIAPPVIIIFPEDPPPLSCVGPEYVALPPMASSSIYGAWTATVVPIPAVIWLFGSALAGLGWLRRK
ncbi:MAG: hypothetical protein E2O50_03875 [Gammaproteobacteria bacterium]|nr:MAG: hypothetical protein E2O50_03875 [Gammaproteobacteria bacterium]